MKTKLILIGRWIAILPVFVCVYILAFTILSFCSRFWASPDSWEIKYVMPIVGSIVSGIYSVVYAAKVAPAHKATVAFTILIIMVLFTGGLMFAEFFIVENKTSANYVNMIGIVASMIGNIVGYQISKNEDELETY